MLIKVIGTEQNHMRFQNANEWAQLSDYEASVMCSKAPVDPKPFTPRYAADW